MTSTVDIAIVGAGAAGLMAAIWAGRTAGNRTGGGARARVAAFDGARLLGAKILVAGGGRCNVTHHRVDEGAYAGSSRHAIKKVLRRFDVGPTVEFFRHLGVELKREETGKLFPVTDNARTVLDALLRGVEHAGAAVLHPRRVRAILQGGVQGDGFILAVDAGMPDAPSSLPGVTEVRAQRVILATGGKSLPKTGSDGQGYELAKALGHTITERVFPALVPLTLAQDSPLRPLSGLTAPATLELRSAAGKRLVSFTNSTLCTHFGLSGPSVLDISRYYVEAAGADKAENGTGRGARLVINWLPGETLDTVDASLRALGKSTPGRFLAERVPERLARAICETAGVDPALPAHTLTRDTRRNLAAAAVEMPLQVTGDRGFAHAEATAGGVPLSEVRLETMESRLCPGLHLCGEICDVDGRIGGFNFQWAWASGYVAGVGAARALSKEEHVQADDDPEQ